MRVSIVHDLMFEFEVARRHIHNISPSAVEFTSTYEEPANDWKEESRLVLVREINRCCSTRNLIACF